MAAWYAVSGIDPARTKREPTIGCLGKVGYPNRSLAIMARAQLTKHFGFNPSGRLDVYCCARCGQFHLGRNPRNRPKPRIEP